MESTEPNYISSVEDLDEHTVRLQTLLEQLQIQHDTETTVCPNVQRRERES